MQIKERGNKIQLLRSVYTTAQRDQKGNLVRGTGRCSQQMIGSFSFRAKSMADIPVELKEVLTEEEQVYLENWLIEKVKERLKAKKEKVLKTIAGDIELATEAIEEGMCLTENEVQKMYSSWGKLQITLRKAGYKRAKKEEKNT